MHFGGALEACGNQMSAMYLFNRVDKLPFFNTLRKFWVFSKGSRHNAGGADAKVL